jgi:hypothetical protein
VLPLSLTLALARYEASKNLSKIASVRDVAGIQVPGTPWATPPAELERLAGYGRDIAKSRDERGGSCARRASPTATPSRSRTAPSPSRTIRSASGSSTNGARSG